MNVNGGEGEHKRAEQHKELGRLTSVHTQGRVIPVSSISQSEHRPQQESRHSEPIKKTSMHTQESEATNLRCKDGSLM